MRPLHTGVFDIVIRQVPFVVAQKGGVDYTMNRDRKVTSNLPDL